MAWQDYIDTIQKIYIAYYQRPADPIGLVYWAQRLDLAGGDLTKIIEAFANSDESKALYGDINEDTIGDVIDAIYQAAFNRSPDEEGKQFYINGFKEGKFTAATIMLNILDGAQNEDLIILQNKIESANNFTKAIDPELDGKNLLATYEGNEDAEKGREFLKDVGATIDTVKTTQDAQVFIKENIADEGDALLGVEVVVGKEFVMTHDLETLQGTNSDDLFKGIVDFATPANTTFQAGDKIIGGAGNDKVEVIISTAPIAGGIVTPVEISGVETISFLDVTGGNNIINAIYFEDNPTISVDNLGGETGIDNLSLNSKVVFTGLGDLSVDYMNASGSDDTVTVELENAGVSENSVSKLFISDTDDATNVITSTNIESLILDTTGTNYVQLGGAGIDDDTLASVKVTGDGENYIVLKDIGDGNSTKVGAQFTFDASEATGNVTVVDNAIKDDTPGDSAEITYKLGSGDDIVVFKADAAGDTDFNNDKIDGGDGTDTIKFDISAAGVSVNYISIKDADLVNVEKIVVYNGTTTNAATIDLSKQTEGFEITGDDGGDTITGSSGADTIDGGKGNDTIKGGKGADTLTGGDGADTFILDSPFNAVDKLTDFTSGIDMIKIDLTTEGAVGALGAGKFGGDNAIDSAYTWTGAWLRVLKFSKSDIGGKLVKKVTTFLGPLPGSASGSFTNKLWLKGKSISFGTKTIKLVTTGGTINISKLSASAGAFTKTGVLFFYDTDDHLLKMYGVKVVNNIAGVADSTIDTVSKLTSKTIAKFTANHDPAATDIVIF